MNGPRMQEKIGEMLSAGQRFVNLWMFLVTKNEQDVPCDILFRAAQDLLFTPLPTGTLHRGLRSGVSSH
jgi:hypothetical protein